MKLELNDFFNKKVEFEFSFEFNEKTEMIPDRINE